MLGNYEIKLKLLSESIVDSRKDIRGYSGIEDTLRGIWMAIGLVVPWWGFGKACY